MKIFNIRPYIAIRPRLSIATCIKYEKTRDVAIATVTEYLSDTRLF